MPPHKSHTLCDGIYLSESAAKKLTDESIPWEDRKPIGIRFNPSDQALARIFVDKCFRRTDNIVLSFFRVRNVYDHEPQNLSNYAHEFGEGKFYFFTPRRKKYAKGKNFERTARGGFWRKTGSDTFIKVMDNSIGNLIVTKTSLAFYKREENSRKEQKTRWLMKEYMLEVRNYENFEKSYELDPLVLCLIYSNDDGKQTQSCESGTRCETFAQGSEVQSVMPNRVLGSSQVSDNITVSNSFHPPIIPIRNYPNLRSSTSTFHDIFGNFSNNPLYPSSNPGISLQQGFPMFLSSEQNMVMGSPGAVYQSSFCEPVLGTCFQLMQDLGQPLDSFMSLPNQQPHFMDDQPQPDPCENSSSIVCSPSNKNNLLDQNGNLNHNIDPIMDPNRPLWSSVFNSYWLQPGNEHGSNQQQQPNSHSSSDQIIQQQLSDSAMTWNPSQQNSAQIIHQSSFLEPVSGTCFQLMQDLGQPLDSSMSYLPNQQPHFMDDQPQPDPCENSSSIVFSPSNKNNLLDHNGNLNHNIDPIMVPNGPLWSPGFNSYWLQSGNEHGSNQQQQPSDSAMTWNPSQQKSAEIIINLQSFDYHPAIFDEHESMEIEALLLAPVGNMDMHEIEDYSAAWIG